MALPPEAAGHAAESSGLGGGAVRKTGERRDSVVIRFAGDSGDGRSVLLSVVWLRIVSCAVAVSS